MCGQHNPCCHAVLNVLTVNQRITCADAVREQAVYEAARITVVKEPAAV